MLDMKTTFLLLVAGHLFTVILISAYWQSHKKDSTFNTFFIAKCLQAIAWFFLILRGGIPDIFTISLANTLLFLGASLECIAVLKLKQAFQQISKKIYIFLTVTVIIGFHLIILFYNKENIRVAFASFGTAVFVIIPAYKLILEKKASLLTKIMGYLYLFTIIFFIGRGIAATLQISMGLFTPGIIQSISFLTLYLVMILGNSGFVLLLKERVDKELVRIANIDDLTGILNRRSFISLVGEKINFCAKMKMPLTLLLFDVDYFKQINDTHGHVFGDYVLRDLSEKISHHIRVEDLFCRYGGDEFAILLPEMNKEESVKFAEKIRQIIDVLDNQELQIQYTLSIGLLTVFPNQGTKWDTLYASCDKALYIAKNKGRNQVIHKYYDPLITVS